MRKLLTFIFILCTVALFAEMRGGAQYDPGAARSNLSNVDATATPSMASITLSGKVKAAWADILGDIYASGTAKVATGTAAAPAYSFGSDPDTGIYSYGSNSIGFSVGGSSHAYLWKSGKYNLFTNPTTDGNDDECLWLGHVDRSQGAGLLLYGNEFASYTGAAEIYIGTNGVLRIVGNGGAESMRVIASTSNVLIGTTTDNNYKLSLFAGSGINGVKLFVNSLSSDDRILSLWNGGSGGTEIASVRGNGNVLIATSTDDGANKLQVNGFTKLGEAATGIKMKVLTGTTGAAEGNSASIAHGISDAGKIVSFTAAVSYATASALGPEYQGSAGYQFHANIEPTNIVVVNHATNSENILSKPITVTIWYKE